MLKNSRLVYAAPPFNLKSYKLPFPNRMIASYPLVILQVAARYYENNND